MNETIFRNTCPRNCYGTCSILSHVKDGKLQKVTGDPNQGYNQGRLCAKGYAYTQFVYSPHRMKYPMLQNPRGSGNWSRISWDEALTIIANKMIELNKQYDSNLACTYNKYSGNLGLLHYAVEGMFNSIGPHTKLVGDPCVRSGTHAFNESLGVVDCPDPEDMSESKLIVLWGANPAVTNVHQMKFIYQAKRKGATLVCIDPIFSRTAEKSDLYIQINPGTDVYLVMGIAKLLIEWGIYAVDFVQEQTEGWEEYRNLVVQTDLMDICQKTGVTLEALTELARLYAKITPAVTWCGFGMQRNRNGQQSVSAIMSLVALTGNLTRPHGGMYYIHSDYQNFPLNLLNHVGPVHPLISESRTININDFASDALALKDPPIKLLWIASRNPLTQDQDLKTWTKLFAQLDLIVTVDLFFTKTAEQSDLVLPASTHFEEDDLNVGYWHHWLSYNQKAISPYYEAKSDLQIARELTRKLNELSPGFSNFPFDKEPLDWIEGEVTTEIQKLYGISGYKDLLNGPRHKKNVSSPLAYSHKYRFFTPHELMNRENEATNQTNMYRLISPQSLLKIHSQFEQLTWLQVETSETIIELPAEVAIQNDIGDGAIVEIYNDYGAIKGRAKLNPHLPLGVVLSNQAGTNPVNQLINLDTSTPNDDSSAFFYDSMVKIRKWGDSNA